MISTKFSCAEFYVAKFSFFFRRDIDDIDMPPTVDFDLPPKPLGLHRESTVTFDPDTGT